MKEAKQPDMEMNTNSSLSRRKFLNYAGAIAGAGVLIASCKKKDDDPVVTADTVELGYNDPGLLNYVYLLKQLSAAFYIKVVSSPYPGMTDTEKGIFTGIRDHEIAHREVLKSYLSTSAIPLQENDWGSVDFNLKTSVFDKARLFEETNVAALNGACRLFVAAAHINTISKMSMVDARHSAIINDFIYMGDFAKKADSNGKEVPRDPESTLEIVREFFKKTISGNNLPKY